MCDGIDIIHKTRMYNIDPITHFQLKCIGWMIVTRPCVSTNCNWF